MLFPPLDENLSSAAVDQHVRGALAPYGSPEHIQWMLERQRKNVAFRRQVEAAEREALRVYEWRRRQRLGS